MAELSHRSHRNGHGNGSTSTIYDYPEHLNPFYEDENHKRLRFWNHKPAAHRSQRRGSLSSLRDGLRELWQYSSIRFGKKRSSTLGINKTSESPPPLRRDTYDIDTSSSAGTSGYRNTVNTPGYGSQSYTTTPLFERHTRYRSSLQPRPQVPVDNDENGFTRNNRYRSTIQNGFATYNSGMVTSTPRKKQAPPQPYGTTPRVPQQHNNSNPFDDELEPDGDTLSTISMDDGYGSTLRSRTGTRTRTKRRAPPPPPVTVKPTYHPDPATEQNDDSQSEDLRNLTAEIASFVSSATGADESSRTETVVQTGAGEGTRVEQTYDVNNNDNARSEIPTTVSSIESEIVHEDHVSLVSVPKEHTEVVVKVTKELQVIETSTVPEKESKPMNDAPVRVETVETVVESVAIRTSPTPIPRKKSEQHQLVTLHQAPAKVDDDLENLALPETPVPPRRSSRERYITEEIPAASKPVVVRADPKPPVRANVGADDDDEGPTTTIIVDNLHYKLKVAPIDRTEIDTKMESARMKISESTGNIPTSATDSGTADRRRSVKDIIESINKSQSMLKVNVEQSGNSLHETQSTDSMTRNIRELNEREKEIQNLLHDIDSRFGAAGPALGADGSAPGPSSGGSLAAAPPGRGSYYDNLPDDNLPDDNLNDNLDDRNNMYAASGYRVKKSPTKTVIIATADDQVFKDCMDWNPLPKPRRSNIMVENATVQKEQSQTVQYAP